MCVSFRHLIACALLSSVRAGGAPCGSPSGGPTDAPTASLFGAGAYPWAESLVNWSCVYNIKDYPSGSADASFASAQAAAVAGGGGVVFFPAGKYAFSGMIELASSVVIRGAPTLAPAKSGKLPGSLAPATTFTCPDRQHQGILNRDPAAHDLGVVNVAFVSCSVMLWPGLLPAEPFVWPAALKSYWYGATGVAGAGARKLVLSNTFQRVAFGSVDPTNVGSANPWAFRFSHAIAAYADDKVLVANNLLGPSPVGPDVTIHLKGDPSPSETLPFPYDLRYGVDNKLLYGAVAGAAVGPGGACPTGWGNLNPSCAPYAFPSNVTIRGNYVFNCGRVAFNVGSGCNGEHGAVALGAGAAIVDNHSEHCPNSTCWTVDGVNLCRGSDTNENRNIDISGYCANITGNSAHVFRQQVAKSKYATVDGECILAQTESNSRALAHLWTDNDCTHTAPTNLTSGPIFFYKMIAVNGSTITRNANDEGQIMGAVFDATHDTWTDNICTENSQPCTCGSAPCP